MNPSGTDSEPIETTAKPRRRSIRTSFLRKERFQVDIGCLVSAPETQFLPIDFAPSAKDIICGRGKSAYNHVGNKRFRVVIAMNLNKYMAAKSRLDKTQLVNSIVDSIRDSSPTQTGFVKQDASTGRWIALGDDVAREKVGHALRDAVAQHQEEKRRKDQGKNKRSTPTRSSMDRRANDLLQSQQSIFQTFMQGRRRSSRSVVARSG